METTRRDFVAGTAAAGIALAAAGATSALAEEAAAADETAETTEAEGDGYSVVETESGLQVTIADDENPDLPTVVVLATGGTIAGVGDAGKTTNYQAGQLDVGTLVASAAGITDIANVRGVQVCNVGSDDITDAYWIQIAETINELAADDAVSGFAITHGTDTLDETAYFLTLAVKTDKPVVITGAMRPSTATSADGPMNLYETIACAASEDSRGRGCLVVFSDGIYSGRDVQKVNTFKTDAFSGRDKGCLGYMLDGAPQYYNATTRNHTLDTEFDVTDLDALPSVAVAYFNIDADPGVLNYYVENGAKGIVIAGAGAGCYSGLWNDAVKGLADTGIPVIRCSRIGNGLITQDDYFEGNVILGGDLAPQKAVVLLRLALTVTTDLDEIAEMFKTY